MVDDMRTRSFFQGAILCLIPALLFIPAAAALTVCPRPYGTLAMKVVAVVFLVSAGYGIRKLGRVVRRKIDLTSIMALVCSLVGLVVVAGCVYGFEALFLRRA